MYFLFDQSLSSFEGVPDVAPQRSISLRDPRTSPSSLRFNWNEPEQSKCEYFNSQLDGYHYELKGTSVWNRDYINHKTTSEHWEQFQDLMPYSGYSLNIYAKNVLGEYNPDLPLTLTANTKPANKAGPPRNLKVIEINEGSQHQVSWLPPFPPTGLG